MTQHSQHIVSTYGLATAILSVRVVHIKPDSPDATVLYLFVHLMSRSKKSASSIVSDTPVASTDDKEPEQPDSSYLMYQRLWYVILAGTADGITAPYHFEFGSNISRLGGNACPSSHKHQIHPKNP